MRHILGSILTDQRKPCSDGLLPEDGEANDA